MEAARHWGHQLSGHLSDGLGILLQNVPARLLIFMGNKSAAMKKLHDLCLKSVRAGAHTITLRTRVYKALAADTPEEAMPFLTEALKMGESQGFIRTFVDEGKLLAPLLRKLLAQGFLPDYTSKLLNIIESEERQLRAQNGDVVPAPKTSGILSERELEILKLVVTGLSNRQISERLIISLGTTKTHVHNIFEKLEVKSRTQAVGKAKELKLL